jgi:hypothetical protein
MQLLVPKTLTTDSVNKVQAKSKKELWLVRKRALDTRTPTAIPQGLSQRWSLDFVSDSLSCSCRFRNLDVIDDFIRKCLAAVVDTSLSGQRVAREARAAQSVRRLFFRRSSALFEQTRDALGKASACPFRPLLGSGPIDLVYAVRAAWFELPKLRGEYEQSLLAERRSDGAAPAILSEEPWCAPR